VTQPQQHQQRAHNSRTKKEKAKKTTTTHPPTMMFKPATFLFICAALLLTTFASAVVQVAGVVDGAVASQPVRGVPGGLRATNAAASVVVTTDNNNDGRRKLQSNKWNWCRKECFKYADINQCLADNPQCQSYCTWYKKAYGIKRE
jgi:hypothetical protein